MLVFWRLRFYSEDIIKEEGTSEIEADNEQWDALLATDKSQALLETMAVEALAEHRAGKTKPMACILL